MFHFPPSNYPHVSTSIAQAIAAKDPNQMLVGKTATAKRCINAVLSKDMNTLSPLVVFNLRNPRLFSVGCNNSKMTSPKSRAAIVAKKIAVGVIHAIQIISLSRVQNLVLVCFLRTRLIQVPVKLLRHRPPREPPSRFPKHL